MSMPRTIRTFTLVLATLLASGVYANAQTMRLTATLSGANETPALLTGGAGTAEVFVNLSTQVVTYKIEIFNMPTVANAGHFHVGGPGLAGPVVVDLTPPPLADDFTMQGTASQSAFRARPEQGIRTWADFLQALVGGQVYVNIHSLQNPGGEIRGQLVVQ
jgi:hypothetical protein